MKKNKGFGVTPVLYLLALIGIALGVLYNNYIQSLKSSIELTHSVGVASDLDAADKTMAALSVMDADGTIICPPGLEGIEDLNCVNVVQGLRQIPEKDARVPNLPINYSGTIEDFMSGVGGLPVQVGIFGNELGIKQLDPWGRYYIVCRWQGKMSGNEEERRAYQVTSAGVNGTIETRCGEGAQGDDYSIMRDSTNVTESSTVWQVSSGLITDTNGDWGRDTGEEGTTLSFAGGGVRVDTRGNIWVPGDLIVRGNTVSYAEKDAIRAKTVTTGTLEATGEVTAGDIEAGGGVFKGDVTIGGTVTGNEGIFNKIRSDRVETDELRAGKGHFTGNLKVDRNIESNSITGNTGTFTGDVNAGRINTGLIRGGRIEGDEGVFSGAVSADEIRASRGYIGRVESTEVITGSITADNGQMTNLTVENIIVTGNIIGGNVDLTGGNGGIDGILPIIYGGTSAGTAEGALDNLFRAAGTGTPLIMARGGTSASTAADALNNLFGSDTGGGVSIRSDRLPIIHSNTAIPSALINNRYNIFSVDEYGRITGYDYQDIITDRIEVEGGGAVIVTEDGIIFKIGDDTVGYWTMPGLNVSTGDVARASLDAGRNKGAIIISVGVTDQRPTEPVIGMIRYNTELDMFEGYWGGDMGWAGLGGGGTFVTGAGKCGRANGTVVAKQPTTDLCDSGTLSIVTAGRGAFTWSCLGIGVEYHEHCFALRQENGRCGVETTYDIGTETEETLCLEGRLSAEGILGDNPWTWTCRGTNKGTSANCSAAKSIDGACGDAAGVAIHTAPDTDLCSVGTPAAVTQDGSTWKWTCEGISGGIASGVCSAPKKIDGVCGSADNTNSYTEPATEPAENLCSVGTNTTVTFDVDKWTWSCTGINGGDAAACTVNKTVDGTCGAADGVPLYSAPAAGLCATGTDTEVIAGETGWTWTCEGLYDGIAAACSADKKIDGTCGSAHEDGFDDPPTENLCATGTASEVTTTETGFSWTCEGIAGGTASSTCTAHLSEHGECGWDGTYPPVDGVCGSANDVDVYAAPAANLCEDGSTPAVSGDGPWTWDCPGSNGGLSVSCSAGKLPPVDGACGSADSVPVSAAPTANLCAAGTETAAALDGETWKWTCEGLGGGTTANCTAPKPTDGACGPASAVAIATEPLAANLCSSGTATVVLLDADAWKWGCEGIGGGASVYTCAAPKITDGACGAAHGVGVTSPPAANLCSSGNSTTVASTGTAFTWSCEGINGGTTVSTCSAPVRIDGTCGSADGVSVSAAPTANLCSAGTETAAALDGETWKWTCEGSGGGLTANCTAPKSTNGACGAANGVAIATEPLSVNLCAAGNATAVLLDANTWKWGCEGINGGTSVYTCSAPTAPPVNGACGSANGGAFAIATPPSGAALCTSGTASAVTSPGGWFSWTCEGTHSGTNSPLCTAAGLSVINLGVTDTRNSIVVQNNKLYMARFTGNIVDVVDLANSNSLSTINIGCTGNSRFMTAYNNKVYMPCATSIKVIDASNAVSTISFPPYSTNGITAYNNKLYLPGANNQSLLDVVNLSNNALSTISLTATVSRLDIQAHNNKLYLTRNSGTSADNLLDVVDLSNNTVSTINLGVVANRYRMAVYNNKLYSPRDCTTTGCNLLDVVDLSNNAVSTINLGVAAGKGGVAGYNNKLYISRDAGNLLDVVDLSNNAVSTIDLGVSIGRYDITQQDNKLYIIRTPSGNAIDVVTLPPAD